MKLGPKYKLAKRLGATIFEKTQTQKFALAQERSAMNKKGSRGRGPTEYGKQLLEKQKVRITYGLSESQFSTYVANAMGAHGANPAELLHQSLEMRLDNIVYRLGLASTRRFARQMVSHGHITVNGTKTTIPSQAIKIGDVIAVREGSKSRVLFENFAEKFAERPLPSWLLWDPKAMSGGVQQLPTRDSADAAGDLATVFSFYSR
ncbi:MAG: rpsD [Parcubacteria group bacterium]|nr:rpsD [Parcubacteria group bacterium]